jgi:hypothetical protein
MRCLSVVLGTLVLAVLPSGCTSSSPVVPTASATVTGLWTGELSLEAFPGTPVRMSWNLTQTGTAVSGPVLVTLPSGIVLLNGALAGTLEGAQLTYTISVPPGGIPPQPGCVGELGGTATASFGTVSTLTGSQQVTSSTCTTPLANVSFTLTRH